MQNTGIYKAGGILIQNRKILVERSNRYADQ